MELLVWNEDKDYKGVFYKLNKINNTFYKFQIELEYTYKSIRVHVAASSGKKRRDLEIFEPNNFKPDGGIKALIWLKQELEGLYEFMDEHYRVEEYRIFILIGWADSQRRDVYSRLEKNGFQFTMERGKKILMKELIYP